MTELMQGDTVECQRRIGHSGVDKDVARKSATDRGAGGVLTANSVEAIVSRRCEYRQNVCHPVGARCTKRLPLIGHQANVIGNIRPSLRRATQDILPSIARHLRIQSPNNLTALTSGGGSISARLMVRCAGSFQGIPN